MSLLEITVQPAAGVTHFDQSVDLEGVRYRFRFYNDTVTPGWSCDVGNADETSVVRAIALAVGIDLLYPYRYLDVPPGTLFVHDQDLGGVDPQGDDFFEGKAALYYAESQ